MTQPTDPVLHPDAHVVTLDRAQLAALLAHHADVLAARWHAVASGPGAWQGAAVEGLRSHAGDLTADEETPAVAELLDSIISFSDDAAAALRPGVEPPATVHVVDYSAPTAAPECVGDCSGCEQEQDRKETEQAHTAGDHQWCGVTCETEFPSDVMRNTILCRAIPGSKSMLAELERRAAQQAPVPPAGQPYALTGTTATPDTPALLLRIEQDGRNSMSGCMPPADIPGLLRQLAGTIEAQLAAGGEQA